MIIQKTLDSIYNVFLTKVPTSKIRTEITPASLKENWGDMPISSLPVYPYFKLYIQGHKDEALEKMTEYYLTVALENRSLYTSKKEGGMKYGSTYTLIVNKHKEYNINLDDDLSNLNYNMTKEAIEERVLQRFRMIDSLKEQGYSPSCQLIHANKKETIIYLTDGHHRVAAMDLLGYEAIPLVINKSWIIQRIRRIFRPLHPRC